MRSHINVQILLVATLAISVAERARAEISGFGGNGSGWVTSGYTTPQPLPPMSSEARISEDVLYITDVDHYWNARSAFYNAPQPIASFRVTFTYENLTGLQAGGGPFG